MYIDQIPFILDRFGRFPLILKGFQMPKNDKVSLRHHRRAWSMQPYPQTMPESESNTKFFNLL